MTELAGERLVEPAGADNLPRFREFNPQREGDVALTSTSFVARRLAQRIGIGLGDEAAFSRSIPVTGQHAVMTSQIRPRRVPNAELPVRLDSPARTRLHEVGGIAWWWYVVGVALACAAAWVLGGR